MPHEVSPEVQASLRELDAVLRIALRIVKNARRAAPRDEPPEELPAELQAMAAEGQRRQVQMDEVFGIVRAFSKVNKDGFATAEDIVAEAERGGLSHDEAERALRILSSHGRIYQKGGAGTWAPMRD